MNHCIHPACFTKVYFRNQYSLHLPHCPSFLVYLLEYHRPVVPPEAQIV